MDEADATLRGAEKLPVFPGKWDNECARRRVAGRRAVPVEGVGAGKSHTGAARVSRRRVHHGGRRALHGKYSDEMIRMMGATRLASGPDGMETAVREQFHKGADVIKLGATFPRRK